MKFKKKYKPLFLPPENVRFIVVTGGRNSGKSTAVSAAVSSLMHNENRWVLYTRWTMTSAEKSIIPEFVEKMDLLNISQHYSITKKSIESKAKTKGSSAAPVAKIDFSGIKTSSGNQTGNLKSLKGYSILVIEEAEEFVDEEIFDKVQLSIRRKDKQNLIILILNPCDKEHFIYRRFFQDRSVNDDFNGVKDDVLYIHTDYNDAIEHVPNDILVQIKSMMVKDYEMYKHIFLGFWRNTKDGVIFTRWRVGDFDESLPYGFAGDYGYSGDPDTLVKVAVDKKNKYLYVQQCMYSKGQSYTEVIEKYKSVVGSRTVIVESQEPRLTGELRKNGINAMPVVKGSVEAEVKLMQDYMIIVCGESPDIIYELNNYHTKNKIIVDKYNHAIDAIRYYFKTYTDRPEPKQNKVLSKGMFGKVKQYGT